MHSTYTLRNFLFFWTTHLARLSGDLSSRSAGIPLPKVFHREQMFVFCWPYLILEPQCLWQSLSVKLLPVLADVELAKRANGACGVANEVGRVWRLF